MDEIPRIHFKKNQKHPMSRTSCTRVKCIWKNTQYEQKGILSCIIIKLFRSILAY